MGTFLMASRTRMSNRRFLVVVSSSLCSSAMVALSLVTHFAGRDEIRGTTASWTALTLLVFFTLSYMTGLGPIPWILIGELLPGNLNKFDRLFFAVKIGKLFFPPQKRVTR